MHPFARFLPQLCLFIVCQFSLVGGALALVNQLKGHPSPYLAIHADDPVAWQDWNQAVIDEARRGDKLLYISIGYFSCHWCHVMQRESYRNNEIAEFLNRHFIPVKVDRELEPALDARMIEFVQSVQGRAGWPLNVFVTPEGHPLYAVLYLPPDRFLTVIQRMQELWTRKRERLTELARRDAASADGPGHPELDAARVRSYAATVEKWALNLADPINGGFGRRSKFPSVPQLEFLLDRWGQGRDQRLEGFLLLTLDNMAQGGLQDHLGGGFFRYTVDAKWTIPHFEKMLYDNALLAKLYLRASRALGRIAYEQVALRSLDFMINELRTPAGAFMASLSAVDDTSIEGGYYLWSQDQLKAVLQPRERRAYMLAWGMGASAPFEQGYLPAVRGMTSVDIAGTMQTTQDEVERLLATAAKKLYQVRRRRKLPKDTKLLAGWNGLALSAFAYAAQLTGSEHYQRVARGIRDYLMKELWDGKSLHRAVSHGGPVGRTAIEDYAYVALGLLHWAKLTGQRHDYIRAREIASEGWKRFYGPRGWRLAEASLIETETGHDLILDGPMPSPAAVLARTSLELAARLRDPGLRDRALSALNSGHQQLQRNPLWNATQVSAMLAYLHAR